MKKPIMICFQGNDGSGKSTQVKKLISAIEKRNLSVKRVWNRFEPRISLPITKIVKMVFFKNKGIYENYSDHVKQKRTLFQNNFISKAYKYIWLTDYLTQISFRLIKSYFKNDVILLDRYYYDAVVDVSTELNFSETETISLVKKLSKFFPRPDLIFLLDVPEEISFERKDDIPSIDYLRDRRRVYLTIGDYLSMINIDGTNNKNEIHSFILECLIRCIHDKNDNNRY